MKFQKEFIVLNNEHNSISFAKTIAKNLKCGEILTFSGDVGCGKTFICREIIKYFCGSDTNIISPTFNLLQIYTTSRFMIYHFDLYRLNYLEEVYELGIEEAFQRHVCLIEWPEIIEKIIPRPITKVCLRILEDNKRSCNISHFL